MSWTSLKFLEYHPSSDGDILELYILPPWASLNWAPRELVRLIFKVRHLTWLSLFLELIKLIEVYKLI